MVESLSERLRNTVQKLRRTPLPIADIAPLLNQAADEIDALNLRLQEIQSHADDSKFN